MSIPVVGFFNNKGGVGKTSLVYHMAWMYADLGRRVLAVDLDPQANLTAAFVSEERLEELWGDGIERATIYDAIAPLINGIGDVRPPHREPIGPDLSLVVGNLSLARFEDELSTQWPLCVDGRERAFRVITAFWRCIQLAAEEAAAEVVLVDLGPNLGAINRSVLVATDHVVVPVAPDLFSLQGLRNLGPTLREWRGQWQDRIPRNPEKSIILPDGAMKPAGYVILQHSIRLDRPMLAYDRWMARIPEVYAGSVLASQPTTIRPDDDEHCLGMLKRYGSLMPMAQEARKPIFHLRSADGALGAHAKAARDARSDFERLAKQIAARSWAPGGRSRGRSAS